VSEASIIAGAERYYTAKLREHGATPRGVDWNDERTQQVRFDLLLDLVGDADEPLSLNDYGCGYGALLDSLVSRYADFRYVGYDISDAMVAEARTRYADEHRARFTSDSAELDRADFTLASGVFNVKLDTEEDAWCTYVLETIGELARLSSRGIAFNALTSHADPERRRRDLFYADPAAVLDHCLRTLSRDVTLRHDYELYEFTVLVRLDARPPVERGQG
jgi:methyltransferase family protein